MIKNEKKGIFGVVIIIVSFQLTMLVSSSSWDGRLTFQEEFSNKYLRMDYWEYDDNCVGKVMRNGHAMDCFRKDKTIPVDNGTMTITAQSGHDKRKNVPFTSAQIRTHGKGFSYGTFVVRARMSKGLYLRPFIYLQPVRKPPGKNGPSCSTSRREELINLVRYQGERPSSLIFSGSFQSKIRKYEKVFRGIDFTEDFHEFAVQWLPSRLQWFVDGKKVYEMTTHFLSDWMQNEDDDPNCQGRGAGAGVGLGRKAFSKESQLVISLGVVAGNVLTNSRWYTKELAKLDGVEWPKPTLDIDYVHIYQ